MKNSKYVIQLRVYWSCLWNWLRSIPDYPIKLALAITYLIGAVWAVKEQDKVVAFADALTVQSPVVVNICYHFIKTYLLLGVLVVLVLLFYPFGRKITERRLDSIGLVNHAGMAPNLLRKVRDKNNPYSIVWEFQNRGIPLQTWMDKQAAIEAVMDISIVKLTYGRSKSRLLVYAVPGKTNLPQMLWWKDEFLSPDNFVLRLGESLLGPVTVNLSYIPHLLLGGATGSGKSILLKSLLMQAIKKGAVVQIADYKGGVDFAPVWHERCQMCFDDKTLNDMLNKVIDKLYERREMFSANGFPDIESYNAATGANLPRIIIGCDEIAEVLDKTGRSKEEKNIVLMIEAKLRTIARMGRAFGIHLILATQRPDANVIDGQIKNNVNFRVCGVADDNLSRIILENSSAADQIPVDARGRFITRDGTVFQGYLFNDRQL